MFPHQGISEAPPCVIYNGLLLRTTKKELYTGLEAWNELCINVKHSYLCCSYKDILHTTEPIHWKWSSSANFLCPHFRYHEAFMNKFIKLWDTRSLGSQDEWNEMYKQKQTQWPHSFGTTALKRLLSRAQPECSVLRYYHRIRFWFCRVNFGLRNLRDMYFYLFPKLC